MATFVIVGATGDLAHRMLLPALFRLWSDGAISRDFAVLGVSRRPWSDDDLRRFARDGVARTAEPDAQAWAEFAQRLHFVSCDSTTPDACASLAEALRDVEERHRTGGNRLFYLASPPSTYEPFLKALSHSGLLRRRTEPWTRLIVEKPFGSDEASARRG